MQFINREGSSSSIKKTVLNYVSHNFGIIQQKKYFNLGWQNESHPSIFDVEIELNPPKRCLTIHSFMKYNLKKHQHLVRLGFELVRILSFKIIVIILKERILNTHSNDREKWRGYLRESILNNSTLNSLPPFKIFKDEHPLGGRVVKRSK